MAIYCTQAQAVAYGLDASDPATLERVLARASRDIDNLLGALPVLTTGNAAGFKLDPAELQEWEADALARSTAAQAEHLVAVDVARAAGPARLREKGPDFEVQYAQPTAAAAGLYGDRVPAELDQISHLRVLSGIARP